MKVIKSSMNLKTPDKATTVLVFNHAKCRPHLNNAEDKNQC